MKKILLYSVIVLYFVLFKYTTLDYINELRSLFCARLLIMKRDSAETGEWNNGHKGQAE